MHAREYYKKLAQQDNLLLKDKLRKHIEETQIQAYILAPTIGISINCLRTFLNGDRLTSFPQRKKIQDYLDQIIR